MLLFPLLFAAQMSLWMGSIDEVELNDSVRFGSLARSSPRFPMVFHDHKEDAGDSSTREAVLTSLGFGTSGIRLLRFGVLHAEALSVVGA